jgi:hypothetical protein
MGAVAKAQGGAKGEKMNDAERKQFDKMLARLTEMVVLGKAHVAIGRGIAEEAGGDPVIAQVAPTFWGMTLTAHLDMAQLLAYKLFDTQGNAMTIEGLLATAEEHCSAFEHAAPEEVQAIVQIARVQIGNLDRPLKLVRAKRNRILAHSDPTIITDPARLEKEVKVTLPDLNQIFFVAGSVLNEISRVFKDTTSIMEIIGGKDYKSVIDLVSDAKSAQVDAWEKEFSEPCPFPRPRSRTDKVGVK